MQTHSAPVRRESVRRVAFASMIGTTIEWYDFFIFGTASALVFGRLFFPDFSELAGTLAAFATFAVGLRRAPGGRSASSATSATASAGRPPWSSR